MTLGLAQHAVHGPDHDFSLWSAVRRVDRQEYMDFVAPLLSHLSTLLSQHPCGELTLLRLDHLVNGMVSKQLKHAHTNTCSTPHRHTQAHKHTTQAHKHTTQAHPVAVTTGVHSV